MKRKYIRPTAEIISMHMEQSMLITFSQVDNDGDGNTDQRPIIEGDPEGGIGAKQGSFSNEDWKLQQYNPWED